MSTADEPQTPPPTDVERPAEVVHPDPANDPPPAPAALVPFVGHALLSLVLGLGGGLAGAYLYPRVFDSTAATPTAPGPVDSALQSETEQLGRKLGQLTGRVDALHHDLEAVEHSVSEVSALQVRVSDLASSSETLEALPKKLESLEARVSDVSTTLASLRGEMKDLRDRPVRVATSRPAATAPRELPDERLEADASPVAQLASEADVERGARLFEKGQYVDASSYFNDLSLRTPDDARVWYYAALCHGFATSDWTGGAAELVEKGTALEKAGHPAKAVIDATFHGLTTETGKDWLGAYRQRVGQGATDQVAGTPRS